MSISNQSIVDQHHVENEVLVNSMLQQVELASTSLQQFFTNCNNKIFVA